MCVIERVGMRVCRCVVLSLCAVMVGCSSQETLRTSAEAVAPQPEVSEAAREKALQHFIDASVYEMKGEYAQAVLEYLDALRYDENHTIYFALARNYSLLNKHALALEAGRKAVQLAPDNLEYRRTLADAYVSAFELDSAATQYAEVIRRDSSSIEDWYNLARVQQGKRPQQALEVYQAITQRFGPEWEVLLQMAELYNAQGQHEKTAEVLSQMTAIDPSNSDLKKNLAQAYLRAGRPDDALTIYHELRALHPDALEYSTEIGAIHLIKREYDTAADYFAPVLASDSVNLDIKLRIGESYFNQMEKDSAIAPAAERVLRMISEKHPDDWRPYWFLGAIGAITKQDSLAVESFRKVTQLASWNPDGWVYLSSIFMERSKFEDVVTVLESALGQFPDEYRINFFLGIAYHRIGRDHDAVRVLEHARQLNPKDINALIQLALVYDALKKHSESDRLYEIGLNQDPENAVLLNNYSYSLAERGIQLERALAMAKKAVAAQPENSSFLDTIGWVYYQMGEYTEAERYIRKAIEVGDASAVVHEHLGDVYEKMNDAARALEHWSIALGLDESNSALREKISRLAQ